MLTEVTLDLLIMHTVQKGCESSQCFFTSTLPTDKHMVAADQHRVTYTDCFLENAVEVKKLKIIPVSLDLSLVIFLDHLIQTVVDLFGISNESNSFLFALRTEVRVGKDSHALQTQIDFFEVLLQLVSLTVVLQVFYQSKCPILFYLFLDVRAFFEFKFA